MQRESLERDVGLAIVWLVGLADLAHQQIHPALSHHLMRAAVLVAVGNPTTRENLAAMRARASNPEECGASRRCLGFLADVLVHLGLVESAVSPEQLTIPGTR